MIHILPSPDSPPLGPPLTVTADERPAGSHPATPSTMESRVVGEHEVRLSDVLGGLSHALDLAEGRRPGHAARTCLIGMRIAEALELDARDRSALLYALLMKDLGGSANASRFAARFGASDQDVKAGLAKVDWPRALESFRFVARHAAPGRFALARAWRATTVLARGDEGRRDLVRARGDQGADIALMLGLGPATAAAIRAVDEHWDGAGQPDGARGHAIPLLGRLVGLAQTVEVFWDASGVRAAYDVARSRRGTWFDPALVDALLATHEDHAFWEGLATCDPLAALRTFEPADRMAVATEERLDLVAEAFARVIDAKSPWTRRHSTGVADLAVAMGRRFGLPPVELRDLRRAALLHDIGKLAVSSLILDKPGRLTDAEFREIRQHPAHTAAILDRVPGFQQVAEAAAAHHERLDGSGYHRGVAADGLGRMARILCVADMCDALRASRPYRAGLPAERILDVMQRDAGTALDADCLAALEDLLRNSEYAVPSQTPAAREVRTLSEDYRQAA